MVSLYNKKIDYGLLALISQEADVMLDVLELAFDYQEQPLLKEVTFHLPAGGLMHLRGGNGAGKTTLLKLIAGLYQPCQGQIQFLGHNINTHLRHYQSHLCFVGHKLGINPCLSLKENCLFDLHYAGQNISELAALFQLEQHLDLPCNLLSAGQKRQVALLRLWMSKAALWLLDEPFVALDETALSLLMSKMESHREQGGAVLLTSHQSLPWGKKKVEEYCL